MSLDTRSRKYGVTKIFFTVQGEGVLTGKMSAFIRLAGCSVGCLGCDTNYEKNQSLDPEEICNVVHSFKEDYEWIWITGGEPADRSLKPLTDALSVLNKKIAIATSGCKKMDVKLGKDYDFLSVSPHGKPSDLVINQGDQINLVPYLNQMMLSDWLDYDFSGFKEKYVTPCDGNKASLNHCLKWIRIYSDFKLGVQAHKVWGVE